MVIKVIGMGCENCDKLYENVMEAVKETAAMQWWKRSET